METVLGNAKKYLDSITDTECPDSNKFSDVFATFLEPILVASTNSRGSTTALLEEVTKLRSQSKYVPVAIQLLHN